MIVISLVTDRYTRYSLSSSEEFTSASRSLNPGEGVSGLVHGRVLKDFIPGLLASGITSAATWAATLLQRCASQTLFNVSTGRLTATLRQRDGHLPLRHQWRLVSIASQVNTYHC